jgi:hypothetical protein
MHLGIYKLIMKMPPLCLFLFITFSCHNNSGVAFQQPTVANTIAATSNLNPYSTIEAIPLPPGYKRMHAATGSFTAWLRRLPLKKSKTVYLYNGLPKTNQLAQFAVIDISTGNKDLQQCADAVMRLRAEYLYEQKRFAEIDFTDNNHTHYRLPANANRYAFNQYLEKVFSYCGTASLASQLAPITDFSSVAAGDVLIKGGFPGHAMQVMDIAINKDGKKIYLLAQSYMPAQDMHVVVNPLNNRLSPWYEANDQSLIETPEWVFYQTNCKKWPSE